MTFELRHCGFEYYIRPCSMRAVLTVDFGSTYTKATLFDLKGCRVVVTATAPSTVGTDVNVGLEQAMAALQKKSRRKLTAIPAIASSSAAGGLRVAVVGFVPELSLAAAKQAALGAGAKIIRALGYKMTDDDVDLLAQDAPDIILLVGGTDGGDEVVILHNARVLAASNLKSVIVLAGNRAAMPACRDALVSGAKEVMVASNLLPTVDTVNAAAVFAIIRDLFMTRIIRAKGIDLAQHRFLKGIVPTPAAVLRGAELLARGTVEEPGLGELLVVDVGGATTDVHSIARGDPSQADAIVKGLPEPYAKRTVEGDLGLRINATTILERVGEDAFIRKVPLDGLDADTAIRYVNQVHTETAYVPSDVQHRWLDTALARCAVEVASKRHAGTMEWHQTLLGRAAIQRGKDLRPLCSVIGVGGIFAYGIDPAYVLEGSCFDIAAPESLTPITPKFFVDQHYILYGIGLLADLDETAAVRIGKRHLRALERRQATVAQVHQHRERVQ